MTTGNQDQGGVACRYCGSMNEPNFVFCSKCGKKRLDAVTSAVPQAPEPYQAAPRMDMGATIHNSFIEQCIGRTKTGVTLMVVAVILLWIPYVLYIGDILAIIGGILIILGRKAFGAKHSRNVIATIVIYLLAIAIEVGIAFTFAFTVLGAIQTGGPGLASSLRNAVLSLLVGSAVVGAMTALVYVLAFYELESEQGKKLLWIAYVVQVAVLGLIFALLYPGMSNAITQAFASTPVNPAPITAFQTKELLYGMLNAIPMLMYAYIFNIARKRLENREIPSAVHPPSY